MKRIKTKLHMIWLKVIVYIIGILVSIVMIAFLYGANRWQAATSELQAKLESGRSSRPTKFYAPGELDGLPAPVQRYFQAALKEGQPLIAAVSVEHTGTFNMSETGEEWKPFKSAQRVITQRPGFVWDARIHMAPGMKVHVHDAYVAGEGVLIAKLFGLVTVMEQPRTPELAQGELMRFFAEATWYPTALLPSQGVVWEAIDEGQARATLTDGQTSVTLVFQFDEQGLISTVRAEGRYRDVNGEPVLTPWQGRFWDYEQRDGMLVPLEGEVAWLLPAGPKPYWRGHIQRLEYEYLR